jgi:Cytochrome P460
MQKVFILFLVWFSVLFYSCTKDAGMTPSATLGISDAEFYTEFKDTSVYFPYKNGTILNAKGTSPHGTFKLRVNAIANAALDSSGKFTGSVFPEGSVIVKEVYNGNSLYAYAVMKKEPSNAAAGNGWIWAEYGADGKVLFGVDKKGNGCIACHSGAGNQDLVLTFNLHQ